MPVIPDEPTIIPIFSQRTEATTAVGVDPGVNGGIAVIHKGSGATGDVVKVQSVAAVPPNQLWLWIKNELGGRPCRCVMEKVGGYMDKGPATAGRANGTRMFTFGRATGTVYGMMVAAGVVVEEVHPKTWQQFYGLKRVPGTSDNAWKNVLKDKATKLFPSLKVTLANADALLLANFCRHLK